MPVAQERDLAKGPSLETYVETRFNLLVESIKDKTQAQDDAFRAFAEAAKTAADALKAAYDASQVATDLRYQQRFEAQGDALAAAFLSQQKAMETALQAAKEAVQAALAAADRAVAKAETAADKRFEALNELRQMLNDMVATLMTRVEAINRFEAMGLRIEAAEGRLNRMDGGSLGHREATTSTRSNLSVIVAIIASLIAVGGLIWTLAEKLK
jgi:hypothetical protein